MSFMIFRMILGSVTHNLWASIWVYQGSGVEGNFFLHVWKLSAYKSGDSSHCDCDIHCLCYEICQMFAKLWWGSSKEKGKIHWRNWSRMCYCKMMVATSSMAFIFFNQVVIAKQSWRIVNRPHYLLA